MTTFLKMLGRYFLFAIFVSTAIVLLFYYSELFELTAAAKSVYYVEKKSKTTTNADTLIIGDSVAEQLYDPKKNCQSINSLACSYSISTVGVYSLLTNYISRNPQLKCVIYLMNPFSFNNDLNLPWTYNYFLKPFNKAEYRAGFNKNVENRISKIRFSGLSQNPLVKITNWSPEFNPPPVDNRFISSVTIDYLRIIKNELDKKSINFVIIMPPISEHSSERLKMLDINIPEDLKQMFSSYFSQVVVMRNDKFLDNIHYVNPEEIKRGNNILKNDSDLEKD